MSNQWPVPRPAPYAPPQAPPVSDRDRRRAGLLVGIATVIAVLMAIAFVASLVLLALADAGQNGENSAYGYLALFLWFGIAAVSPVLLAVGIPGLRLRQRVRQQQRPPGFPPF